MDQAIAPESVVPVEVVNLGTDKKPRWRIAVHSNMRDKDLVAQIPGANFERATRTWYTRLSWSACIQLRGIFKERLQIGPNLAAWATSMKETRIDPALALRDAQDVPGWDVPHLYPLQKVGTLFMHYARNALLGDEVGAGKTRQIITALELSNAYPAIVVAPKSVKDSWAEEFAKIAPHRKITIVRGTAAQRRKQLEPGADVYILHWDIMRLHTRLAGYGNLHLDDKEKEEKELNFLPYKSVVVDEAHRMQDPKAKQTRAVWWLGDRVPADGMRLAATGTWIEKDVGNGWPQLRFIEPDDFPSKSNFIDRYALTNWNPMGFTTIAGLLPEHKEEFFQVVDARFIRRPTKVVVPYLPEPIRMPLRKVELRGPQAKAYTTFRDELITELENGVLMAKNPLTVMGRLQQLAAASLDVDPDDPKNVRMKAPSAVIDELLAVLAELGGKQALIFSESRQLMELAYSAMDKAGYRTGLITGAIGEEDRTANRLAFEAGQLQHLGLTMGAGGEGLTLTAASAMIFIQRSFSLKRNTQAEGRAVRPGQDERVLIIDIVPILTNQKGEEIPTVYQHVLDTLVYKGENAEEILRDKETISKFLSKGAVLL